MTVQCQFEDGKTTELRHATATAIVVRDGQLLLTRRADFLLEGGKLALPGGYMDKDETITETVTREVLEETGYSVSSPQLFRIISQPHRPNENNRQNVDFIFICTAGDQVGQADQETTEILWVPLEQAPVSELAFDQPETLSMFLDHQRQAKSLPILD